MAGKTKMNKNISPKIFSTKLKIKIIPFILSLSILTVTHLPTLPASLAAEKTKSESDSFKIPHWLNLYMDMDYTNGKNYYLSAKMGYSRDFNNILLDIKGRSIYDISVGTSIVLHLKSIPVYFNIDISNLYDGLKKQRPAQETIIVQSVGPPIIVRTWDESSVFISYSTGLFKKYSNYIFNTAFSYSTNINAGDNSISRNYVFFFSFCFFCGK